jgi:hypothetical protein
MMMAGLPAAARDCFRALFRFVPVVPIVLIVFVLPAVFVLFNGEEASAMARS